MNDRVIDKLKQADAALYRGDDADGVLSADQIVARSAGLRRERLRKRIGISTLVAIGAIGTGFLTVPSILDRNRDAIVVHEIGVEDEGALQEAETVASEIEQLRIESRLLIARLDWHARQADRQVRSAGRALDATKANPRLRAALAAETAGQAMLLRGDLLRDSALTRQMASPAYERVIELFPNSAAASDARMRLASLISSKGDKT